MITHAHTTRTISPILCSNVCFQSIRAKALILAKNNVILPEKYHLALLKMDKTPFFEPREQDYDQA